MKSFRPYKIILIFFLFCNVYALRASDFTTIYNRMYIQYSGNPSASSVTSILNLMGTNGNFTDIDYATTSGDPGTHVQRLSTLAQAYKNPSNANYNNADVKAKFLLSLNYWINTNHNASNWWYRYIDYPKGLSKGVTLMANEIKADPVLLDKTVKYLRWSFGNSSEGRLTGANGADIIIGSLIASILTENHNQMLQFKTEMDRLLSFSENEGEGIEYDYMFGQHSGYGRQVYIMNYGAEYLNSVLYYLEFCNGTQYNSTNLSVLENFYIDALQWIFFKSHYDPNQKGRFNSSDHSMGYIVNLTSRMVALNTPRKAELEKVRDRISGENSLIGNRMFWRFDYMINRRANYMTSSRMSSTRTVGSEAGLGSGEYNYYSGSGTNYIFYTGKEYEGNYFSNFNYRQFPGITAEQDNGTLPIPNWGINASSASSFAGGASDGTYGVCGMILQRRGVTANKSWFYFDDEFICLGAGINQSNGTASVYTTINQCNKASVTPQFSVENSVSTLSGTQTLTNPDWILNGGIAYFNLDESSNIIVSTADNLFSANIDHGVNPSNKTYAYIVKPGVLSIIDAMTYSKSVPIEIESNTSLIQAIRHKELNMVEALFYQAGTLQLSNGTVITVDQPCAIVLNENSGEVTIANPYCETQNPAVINLNLNLKNKIFNLAFDMPTGVESGRSISKIATGGEYPVPVTGISISDTAISLFKGQTINLSASVLPSDASNKSIIWSSDNELVATVSLTGSVTILDIGNVKIRATSDDGNFKDSCMITVLQDPENLINYAFNKPATASSTPQLANSPSKAFDGDTNTLTNRWTGSDYPQWLEVDLGAVVNIFKTEVICGYDRAYMFIIEAKDSASGEYSMIVDRSTNTTLGTASSPITDYFLETKARFVRITVNGEGSEYTGLRTSLTEFRVIGIDNSTGLIPTKQIYKTEVYPNPFNSTLNIDARNSNYTNAILYDISGKIILSAIINEGEITELSSSKNEIPSGFYFLKLYNETHSETIKVMRTKL